MLHQINTRHGILAALKELTKQSINVKSEVQNKRGMLI